MENQGQRELKVIRHVYGVLVIHGSVPKDCLAHNLTLQHNLSESNFCVLCFIFAEANHVLTCDSVVSQKVRKICMLNHGYIVMTCYD